MESKALEHNTAPTPPKTMECNGIKAMERNPNPKQSIGMQHKPYPMQHNEMKCNGIQSSAVQCNPHPMQSNGTRP